MKINMGYKMVWMMVSLTILALLTTACGPSEGASPDDTTPGVPVTGEEQELINEGENIYANQCAACHVQDGSGDGGTFPALDGNQFVLSPDPTPVIEVVKHGRGAMPAFGTLLEDREIASVVTYIRSAWSNSASTVSVEQVQAVP
jgi:mono/diheme cytochrome c family protein